MKPSFFDLCDLVAPRDLGVTLQPVIARRMIEWYAAYSGIRITPRYRPHQKNLLLAIKRIEVKRTGRICLRFLQITCRPYALGIRVYRYTRRFFETKISSRCHDWMYLYQRQS
jgi:hypothetical protein